MQKVRVPQNSFQFGEISDSLIMRTDSPVYVSSAQRVENMIVTSEGSLKKRHGLKHHYDYSIAYDASYKEQSHLFKFEFDDNEAYVISVEHQKVRCFFLDNAGTYTTAGDLHLVQTITQDTSSNALPFDKVYLQEYTFAQYGDVMFICHPLFAPRMLTRTALDAFEISVYSFDKRADNKVTFQPYSKFQASGVTLDPSATTGSGVTFTTSSAYWVAGHVGTTIRYGGSEVTITGYTSSTVVTGTVVDELKIRLSVLNPLRTIDGTAIIEVTHLSHGFSGSESITVEEASAVGGINASQINGARTVGGIIDENTYTITAGSNANDSEDGGGNVKVVTHAPTEDWDEQSWSGVRGYPAAVTFHENRLSFGGTIAEPDNIWMSKIGNFFNFDVGDAADSDSIQLVAATGDVNQIRFMVSNRDLQIFTATGELYIPTYLNQAITPTNAQIRKQTPYGCEFVQPTSIDGATIFTEMGGNTVREYLYTDTEEAYTSTSISTIASHLIDTPKYLAVVHSGFDLPDSYAAFTLSNGEITLFSSNRAEKKASWTRVTTDGIFSSVCAIHNRLFANVYYSNKLHLCEFSSNIGLDNWSSLTYNPATFTNFNTQGVWTSGSVTVKLRFYVAPSTLAIGDSIYITGLSNNSVFTSAGVTLTTLNNTIQTVTDADSSNNFIEIYYTLASPSGSSAALTVDVGGTLSSGRYVDLRSFSASDTVDVIFTEGSAVKYSTATVIAGPTIDTSALGSSNPDTNSVVYVGKKYTAKVISNPVDASMGTGPATGEVRGITNVVIDVKSTESMKINSRPAISSSFTGKKEVRLLGYSRNPQITIEQDSPLPMQVNGIVAELIV
tara:strand:- start:9424 stop:11949 length:2526 start_codon:yes stop_codon:yes gene_type:complete